MSDEKREEAKATVDAVEDAQEQVQQAVEDAEKSVRLKKNGKPRMARGKFWGIVGIIVVVLVVAGAGMFAWHEQPSFCSTMCHIEADYVKNYEQPQNTSGTDAYGMPVANTNSMLAVRHRVTNTTAKPTMVCIDCHQTNLAEMATDGMHYVTGDYKMPRDERSLDQMMKWENKDGSAFCVNDRCHSYLMGQDGLVDYTKLQNITQQREFNPHEQHHEGIYQCSNCHKGHRASVMMCTGCHEHENVAVPEGWLTYSQGVVTYDAGLKKK